MAGCGGERRSELELPLVSLLPLADAQVETSAVALGAPAAEPLLVEGWGRADGGGARVVGERAVLALTVVEPRPLELLVEGRLEASPDTAPRPVDLALNGRALGRLELRAEPPLRRLRVALPAAGQVAGVNRLELAYGDRAAAEAGARGAAPAILTRVALDGVSTTRRPRAADSDLLLPLRTAVSFYLGPSGGGSLSIARLSAWRGRRAAPPGVATPRLRVLVESAEGGARGSWEAAPGQSAGESLSFPLPASEGPLRLTLAAVAGGAAPPGSGLRLHAPTLRTLSTENRAAPASGRRRAPRAARRPDIVVYLIDTLRADHLGSYGYERPTSPEIDRFAADATLFTGAVAQSSWTRPAVASLFTGLYPEVHAVTSRQAALPHGVATLAELLRELGYTTAAVSTNPYVTRQFGLDRGFDTFVELPVDRRTREVHELSDRLNREAFAWLEERPAGRPFFLYLHSTDPHLPYAPRSPYRERFARSGSAEVAGTLETIDRLAAGELEASAAVRERLIDLYDAEIAFNDAAFGELCRRLEQLGLYDSSLIVLLADHGEEFGDHGLWTHGKNLYSEQLVIPWIVRLPGGEGAGLRLDAAVRQVDLLPTLLDYLGAEAPAAVQGTSFLGAFEPRSRRPAPAPVTYAHLGIDGRRQEAVILERRKLVHRARRSALPAPVLEHYDLRRDPAERVNLALTEPVWTGYLLSLSRVRELWRPFDTEDVEISDELRETLEALGYVQ